MGEKCFRDHRLTSKTYGHVGLENSQQGQRGKLAWMHKNLIYFVSQMIGNLCRHNASGPITHTLVRTTYRTPESSTRVTATSNSSRTSAGTVSTSESSTRLFSYKREDIQWNYTETTLKYIPVHSLIVIPQKKDRKNENKYANNLTYFLMKMKQNGNDNAYIPQKPQNPQSITIKTSYKQVHEYITE